MPRKQKPDGAALKQLKQELQKGAPGQLYVFYGEEAYLREFYLDRLKKVLLPPGLETFNLHAIPGKECTLQRLTEAADCLPMMSERTLVAVTDFDLFGGSAAQRDALAELFGQLPDYCCLVFLYDLLEYKPDQRTRLAAAIRQYGLAVNFVRQEKGDLVDWISRRFRALDRDIAPREAEYLIARCGDLMHNLVTEIGKIAAYARHPRITQADIDAVAVPQIDAVVFQMTDAITRSDFEAAAAVLSDLLGAQESPIMLLSVIGKYFRQLYTARLLLERRQGVSELAALWHMKSSWGAEKLMAAARRYPLPWCRSAVRRCAQTDLAMKSGMDERSQRDLLVGLLMELSSFS